MNTSITLSLDTRRILKDKTYPIILRISHGRRTINISTGYSVEEKYWDSKNRKVKTSCTAIENVTRVNNYLLRKRSEAMSTIADLELAKELPTLSTQQIKKKIVGKSTQITFNQYTQKLIDSFTESGRIGNARSYKNVLREMQKFKHDVDFRIEEINYEFLKDFEKTYLSRGNSVNGLAVYLRTLRAIFNYAVKDGIVENNYYPFHDYRIKTKPTAKRSISFDSIMKIVDLDLKDNRPLFLARNLFLTSFYMMGAPFIDLAFLQVRNIKNGRIKYSRKKTGKAYDIKITPQLENIISFYVKNKKEDDFIFPIIKTHILQEQYDQVLYALQRHNKKLKQIAKLAEIDEVLSSYVSRHSFASLANNNRVPITAISEMLGHTSIKTTQIYLSSLGMDQIDDYNEQIIGGG